jgi:hypothetical protein
MPGRARLEDERYTQITTFPPHSPNSVTGGDPRPRPTRHGERLSSPNLKTEERQMLAIFDQVLPRQAAHPRGPASASMLRQVAAGGRPPHIFVTNPAAIRLVGASEARQRLARPIAAPRPAASDTQHQEKNGTAGRH